jgi:hypothetical protein
MLTREEYIEQAYLFRIIAERLPENVPLQELLEQSKQEVLATTKLPMAIDFLLGELRHLGVMGPAMRRLKHYFTPFQAYLIEEAENDRSRFDLRMAVEILRSEASYRSESPTRQGLFLFQFETLCRHRLKYDPGLLAISQDVMFDEPWRTWILQVRRQIGLVEFGDLLYVNSEFYDIQQLHKNRNEAPEFKELRLFGEKEGRIALANRHKDPLYLFAALQRQLGYPAVPRPKPVDASSQLLPQLARRMERLELRLKLLEEEQRGGAIDITKFYGKQATLGDDLDPA